MTLIDPQTTADTGLHGWVPVCALSDLEVERGRAALLGGTQIALFLTRGADGREGRVYAVSNFDPFSRANVISRGIVGTRQDAPTVASPMFKQVFDLRTGVCLDAQGKEPVSLHSWPTAVDDGIVLVRCDDHGDGRADEGDAP
jgi:nitrite reductase (NADH) small subunit